MVVAAVFGSVLISPAVLFMAALVIRNLQPQEIAAGAQRIVMWYAGRLWTLWALLLALPFMVLIGGCMALFHDRIETQTQCDNRLPSSVNRPAFLFVAGLTFSAAGILVVVVLHMLAN